MDKTENDSFNRDYEAISKIMDESPVATVEPTEPPVQPQPIEPPPPAVKTVPEAVVTKDPPPAVLPSDPKEQEKYLETFQPKTTEQIKAFPVLKGHIKDLSTQLAERENRIKQLEADKAAIQPITPELQSELEELRKMRYAQAPDQDPEIKSKFIDPIKQKNEFGMNILKAHGMKDWIVEVIDKAGGLSAISRSNENVPSRLGGDKTWSEWLEDVVLANTPATDRRRLENILTDILDLQDNMTGEVEQAKVHWKERMENKFQAMGKEFEDGMSEVVKDLGVMAQRWEAGPESTPEEKKVIDRHNELLDSVIKQVVDFRQQIGSPKAVGRMAAIAGQATYLAAVNADLNGMIESLKAENKDLQERMNKIKGSSSAARITNAPPPGSVPTPPARMTDMQAVNEFIKSV